MDAPSLQPIHPYSMPAPCWDQKHGATVARFRLRMRRHVAHGSAGRRRHRYITQNCQYWRRLRVPPRRRATRLLIPVRPPHKRPPSLVKRVSGLDNRHSGDEKQNADCCGIGATSCLMSCLVPVAASQRVCCDAIGQHCHVVLTPGARPAQAPGCANLLAHLPQPAPAADSEPKGA